MATHSSTLAWKIPWTEEPGRLQSYQGSQKVRHYWATSHTHTHKSQLYFHEKKKIIMRIWTMGLRREMEVKRDKGPGYRRSKWWDVCLPMTCWQWVCRPGTQGAWGSVSSTSKTAAGSSLLLSSSQFPYWYEQADPSPSSRDGNSSNLGPHRTQMQGQSVLFCSLKSRHHLDDPHWNSHS